MYILNNLISMQNSKQTDSILSQQPLKSTTTIDESIQKANLIQKRVKEAMAAINNEGRYQKIVFAILSLEFTVAAYFLLSSGYLFMNPTFTCDGVTTPQDEACQKINQCTLENDYTITAELKLYCGSKADERNLVQSMLGLGSIFGVILINFISDYQGRRFSILLCIIFQLISAAITLIGTSADSVTLLCVSQFLASFASSSYWTVYYVMVDKLFSKGMGERSILLANIFFCLSYMTMIIFSELLSWRYFVYITMLGSGIVLAVLILIFLVEDPILLFTKARYQECINSLKYIAKINNTSDRWSEVEDILGGLHQQQESQTGNKVSSVKEKMSFVKEFKKPVILVPILLLGGQFLSAFSTSFTLFFTVNNIGVSYGVNFVIIGVCTMVLLVPMYFLSHRMPRKKTSFVLTVGMIVTSACLSFKLSRVLQTVITGSIILFQGSLYVVLVIFVVETFPQHIQSTAYGAILTIGEFGKLLAPLFVRVADGLRVSPMLLTAVVNIVFGLLLLIPIKETLKKTQ